MADRYKNEGAGKGDKSRISDYDKYSKNMEKIFEKKSWQFWVVWEGYDPQKCKFDESGLKDNEPISYSEYMSRIIKLERSE